MNPITSWERTPSTSGGGTTPWIGLHSGLSVLAIVCISNRWRLLRREKFSRQPSTVYAASLLEEVEPQDLTGTLHVLAEQLRATLAIFRLRGETSLTKK